ncbi:hypothetical protein U1839_00695 [Sphingomonas sp. RT2P30]|uniref:hypothetical protein n=1 Tax=Parasphingomonas halimpatiens TaxID=3096162 RepID=UPI002FC9144C
MICLAEEAGPWIPVMPQHSRLVAGLPGAGRGWHAGVHLEHIETNVFLEALAESRVTIATGVPPYGPNRGLLGFTELSGGLDRLPRWS